MTGPTDTERPLTDRRPLAPLSVVRANSLGRSAPVLSTTPLGTVDAGPVADVDGAGLVQVRDAEWSLDWWVGAEDRWHHPSRESAVRQQLLGGSPVVETAMRVPGGDVVHRAFGVRATADGEHGSWDDSAVVVEVENLTAVPVALAFALRPTTLSGPGRIGSVENDGAVIRVDGRVALVLSRDPARVATGSVGEPAELLARGEDMGAGPVSVRDTGDGLEVAFVVPLPHTAVARVLLPRPGEPRRRLIRPSWGTRRTEPGPSWSAPDADTVVSGWEAHTRSAVRVEVPEPALARLVEASQRTLVVAAGDSFLEERGSEGAPTAAAHAIWLCEALERCGLEEPAGPLARALMDLQRLNGTVRMPDGSDATQALLHAAVPLLASGSERWAEDLIGPVAKAVHRVGKGTLESGVAVPPIGEALARLAPALRAIDQPDVAAEAERLAGVTTTAPVAGGSGVAARSTFVRQALRGGDGEAVAELLDLARLGHPGAVADSVDGSGVPDGVLGFDPAAVANRLNAVLDAALLETPTGPAMLPGWPSAWWGQHIEVHGVRTRWGVASYGVRWHGERPAVLWEIERAAGLDADAPAPVLTAPVLDPAWRGEGWVGEALLAPVPVPDTFVSIGGGTQPMGKEPSQRPVDLPPAPGEGDSFS